MTDRPCDKLEPASCSVVQGCIGMTIQGQANSRLLSLMMV